MNVSIKLFLALCITLPALAMQVPHHGHPEQKTELHLIAAHPGHEYEAFEVLEEIGAHAVHARDIYGNTPLHEACYFGSFETAYCLLGYGADINAVNQNGLTPLDKAINGGQQAIQELLIQNGGVSRAGKPKTTAPKAKPAPSKPTAPQAKQPASKAKQPVKPAPKKVVPQPAAPKAQLAIAPCLFPERSLLKLPGLTGGGLKIPGVYHVYSQAPVAEEQGWSCAFHSLDNMRSIEHKVCNRNISKQTFINACRQHAANPQGGSASAEQANIAHAIGLPHMVNLEINDAGQPTTIIFDGHADRYGTPGKQEKQWTQLRNTFAQSHGPICIHFCAGIMSYTTDNPNQGEGHGVTISVTKNAQGQVAIYIFDNVNDAENRRSQDSIARHVEFIYRKLIG